MIDARSADTLATLLPKAQAAGRAFLEEANAVLKPYGLTVKAIGGNRSYAEQDALYAQGRTRPGSVVTNAKGGYSLHNFQIAFDCGIFCDKKYLQDSPHYKTIGKLAGKHGLEWGGDWKSLKDFPHYQLATKLGLAQMRDLVSKGQTVA